MDLYDQSTSEEKVKMAEFYLHRPDCVGPQFQARGSAINGHGVMDEPWRIEGSRNEKIGNKRAEWTIDDKSWAIISYDTHQHTQPACQWPLDCP